jgi:hypothetical protein
MGLVSLIVFAEARTGLAFPFRYIKRSFNVCFASLTVLIGVTAGLGFPLRKRLITLVFVSLTILVEARTVLVFFYNYKRAC